MDVVGVASDDIDRVAPLIAWHLESFAERSGGRLTVDGLLSAIRARDKQCWLALDGDGIRACALTEVADGPEVVITQCAGEAREDWQREIVGEIKAWAKHIGARRLTIVCRPGWAKFLKSEGLRETHRMMEMAL